MLSLYRVMSPVLAGKKHRHFWRECGRSIPISTIKSKTVAREKIGQKTKLRVKDFLFRKRKQPSLNMRLAIFSEMQ